MQNNNIQCDLEGGVLEDSWMRGGPMGAVDAQGQVEFQGVCKCKMHRRPQIGVPDGLGCWKVSVGNHVAVRAASSGTFHICAVEEHVRKKDALFYQRCMDLRKIGNLAYEHPNAYSIVQKKFATGNGTIDSFGRGYCYLNALRSGYENRIARIFGPNMYGADLLKVLCVAGASFMKPLTLVEIAPGFLHVERVPGAVEDSRAGKNFYLALVKFVKKNEFVRIGATIDIPDWVCISGGVRGLQFGDFVPRVSWDLDLEKEVLKVVGNELGLGVASALRDRLSRETSAMRNARNRNNKKLAKMVRAGMNVGSFDRQF